jgi:hypothetical protein
MFNAPEVLKTSFYIEWAAKIAVMPVLNEQRKLALNSQAGRTFSI